MHQIHALPFFELLSRAHSEHIKHHNVSEIQVCHLISIKTGGCQEDCKYCAQSSRYQTSVRPTPLMKVEDVLTQAKKAIDQGASRICLGAAWRETKSNYAFEQILNMVEGITALGAEVCTCLWHVERGTCAKIKGSRSLCL